MKDLSGFDITGPNGQICSKYIDGTGLKCSCTGTSFTGTSFTGTSFTGTNYTESSFTGSNYTSSSPYISNNFGFSGTNYQFGPYGVKNKTLFLGHSGTSYYFSDGSNNSNNYYSDGSGSYIIDSSNNSVADQSSIEYGNKYIYKNLDEANKNNNSYHKKISVSKEIANYFNLSHTLCNFNDLVYAILNKSKENKVNTNSIQSVHFLKESTICLDGYGKKLFKIKCNFIEINCLIDFILQQKSSDYFYYENEQKPVHVNSLY